MTDKPDRRSVVSFSDFAWTVLRSAPVRMVQSVAAFRASVVIGVVFLAVAGLAVFFVIQQQMHHSSAQQQPPPLDVTAPMTNPEPGMPSDPQAALATVVAAVDFPVKLPTYFATSADKLAWANDGPHPANPKMQPPLRPDFMYISDKTVPGPDKMIHPSVQIMLFGQNTGVSGGGKLFSKDLSGYIVYKAVSRKAPDGTPEQVVYYAGHEPTKIIMTFTGEQPTKDGLAKMLASFKVVGS